MKFPSQQHAAMMLRPKVHAPTINHRLNVVVRSPNPPWMAVGLPENSSYPGHSPHPIIFSLCYPLNERRRQHSISLNLIACLLLSFSAFFFRILILLLLLMSGNVYLNHCLVFLCSLYAGNVTWRSRSVQCCTCSTWVHLRCSPLFFSKFNPLGCSYYSSCFP